MSVARVQPAKMPHSLSGRARTRSVSAVSSKNSLCVPRGVKIADYSIASAGRQNAIRLIVRQTVSQPDHDQTDKRKQRQLSSGARKLGRSRVVLLSRGWRHFFGRVFTL